MPYKLHTVQIHSDGMGAAVNVPDIASESLDFGPEIDAIITAGETSPTFQALLGNTYNGSFDAFSVPTILDAIGMSGLCIASDVNPGVTAYLQQFDECGDPVAGSNHRSLLIKSGFIFPRTLQVDHRGHARLTVGIAIVKKAGNDAIVISDSAALPTISVASARWSLGSISLESISFPDNVSLTIDFGNDVQTRGVSSDLNDKYVEMRTHAPRITISGIDPTWFAAAAIPINGLACTHANSKIYLRKRAEGNDGYELDATAEHISFTVDGLAIVTQAINAGDAQRFTETVVEVRCKKDASGNAPLIYDGATAIT